MDRTPKAWREFEEAVARFAAAMDPQAVVSHDIRLPDRDTKRGRQRDVWIEAKICGHFPVRILVSCKRYARKLHQGDIDRFIGELSSSDAHKGVIYSYSGFGKTAIEKAEAREICCCKLFENEPADIPLAFSFTYYCCSSKPRLSISPPPKAEWGCPTWGDLLEAPMPGTTGQVVDTIADAFNEAERLMVANVPADGLFPASFHAVVAVPSTTQRPEVRITAIGEWRFFRARLQCILLKGSYSYTSQDFKGSIMGPWIDRISNHPGPGWEELSKPPAPTRNLSLAILHDGDIRSAFLRLGKLPLVA